MINGSGFLAIWSDVERERETDYLHWLTREHTQERLGVPGFLSVRVFRARLPDVRRYFILYRLEGPEVVGSAAYLARLNDPTPWSRRIMPTLGNFARGGGRRKLRTGSGRGAAIVPLVIDQETATTAKRWLPTLAERDRINAVELLAVDRDASEIRTDEKAIRTGDRSFDALLVVEGLDESAVRLALSETEGLPGATDAPSYEQVFALERSDLG